MSCLSKYAPVLILLLVGCTNQTETYKDPKQVEVISPTDKAQPEITGTTDVYAKVSVDEAFKMVKVKASKLFPFPDEVEFPDKSEFIIISNIDNSYTFKAISKFRDSFNKISTAKWEATIELEGDANVESDWTLSDFNIE